VYNPGLVDGSFGEGRSLGISSDGQTLAVGAPAQSFNCITPGLARVFRFSQGDWSQIGSSIDSEKRYREEDNWGTDFVAISGNGERLVVGGRLIEPNWREDIGEVSCSDSGDEVVGSIRVFDLGLATMPPSTQPSTVTPTSAPSTSGVTTSGDGPTSNPTPKINRSEAQPTTSPTLAPSDSFSTATTMPTESNSAAFTKGICSGYVGMSGLSVVGTFLMYL
jgi:hypothetical protein